MTIKNQQYLNRLRKRFQYTDNFEKSDIEIVREDSRRIAFALPLNSIFFAINLFLLIDLQFDRDQYSAFHAFLITGGGILFGVIGIVLIVWQRRSESCRSELEDQILEQARVSED